MSLIDDFLNDTCTVTWLKSGDLLIEAPYNPCFVDDLKRDIPWGFREWDPDERIWLVKKQYADVAYGLCRDRFEFVDEERE